MNPLPPIPASTSDLPATETSTSELTVWKIESNPLPIVVVVIMAADTAMTPSTTARPARVSRSLRASSPFSAAFNITAPIHCGRWARRTSRARFIVSSTSSAAGSGSSCTSRPSQQEHHAVGVRGRVGVVGDHHDRLVELAAPTGAGTRRISVLERESRLPVGSSAKITSGLASSARAHATRCCWPPDSSLGRWVSRSARPTASTTVANQSGSTLRFAMASGSVMFSSADSVGSRLNCWKTNPTRLRRRSASPRSPSPPSSVSPIRISPAVHGVQSREAVHERGLAGSGRAHDRGELGRAGCRPRCRRAR